MMGLPIYSCFVFDIDCMMYQLMVAGQSGLTGTSVSVEWKIRFRVADDPATSRHLSTGGRSAGERFLSHRHANIFLVSKTQENI